MIRISVTIIKTRGSDLSEDWLVIDRFQIWVVNAHWAQLQEKEERISAISVHMLFSIDLIYFWWNTMWVFFVFYQKYYKSETFRVGVNNMREKERKMLGYNCWFYYILKKRVINDFHFLDEWKKTKTNILKTVWKISNFFQQILQTNFQYFF